jgi:hypothetical protein
MSTWAAPATFSSGAVLTAAQLNATRDNLNWLKGALNVLTNSTAADTGTTTRINLTLTSATDLAVATSVAADGFNRFAMQAGGRMEWGPGSGGADVALYRNAANTLRTDTNLSVGASIGVDSSGFISFTEIGAPAAAPANGARLFAVDNGAGKTRLSVQFPTGAAVTVATEP